MKNETWARGRGKKLGKGTINYKIPLFLGRGYIKGECVMERGKMKGNRKQKDKIYLTGQWEKKAKMSLRSTIL
jgi:hypothetical protein